MSADMEPFDDWPNGATRESGWWSYVMIGVTWDWSIFLTPPAKFCIKLGALPKLPAINQSGWYDQSSSPGVDDYLIDADYPIETYI